MALLLLFIMWETNKFCERKYGDNINSAQHMHGAASHIHTLTWKNWRWTCYLLPHCLNVNCHWSNRIKKKVNSLHFHYRLGIHDLFRNESPFPKEIKSKQILESLMFLVAQYHLFQPHFGIRPAVHSLEHDVILLWYRYVYVTVVSDPIYSETLERHFAVRLLID